MFAPAARRFPIRVDRRYRWILRIFGVNESNAYVDLGDALAARFGWSRVTTPVSNLTRWSIEGPWSPSPRSASGKASATEI